LTPQYLLKKNI